MTASADLTELVPAAQAAAFCVFLDIDGTLLEFADRPDAVYVSDDLLRLLTTAENRLGGAMAMVTGRSVASVDSLFDPVRLPCAGLHGLEIRPAPGAVVERHEAADLETARDEIAALLHGIDGILIEDKGACVAVHYRNAQDAAAADAAGSAVRTVRDKLGDGYTVLAGNKVFELKPTYAHKGHAVDRFMAWPPFDGRRPVFIGDDVTDEDGFQAVNARGGLSVIVGDRTPTAAHHRVPGVATVHGWLAHLSGLSDVRSIPA